MPEAGFGDSQLLRYSRQIMLPEIGLQGQQTLHDSCVLIIGMGGLGIPLATYLATSGVGKLILVDDDWVELGNLPRQPLYVESDVGMKKVTVAAERLRALNSEVEIQAIAKHSDEDMICNLVSGVQVVADCSDNFQTRFAVNRACWRSTKPLVSAAVIRMEGQLSVFDSRNPESPCYACLYSESLAERQDESCVENGVVAPLAGMMGCAQAMEVIKLLLNIGSSLTGQLLMLDALLMKWRDIRLRKNPGCAVCGTTKPLVR